jgi:hypothetical protein
LLKTRPGFDVEFFNRAESLIAQFGLVLREVAMELGAEWIAFGSEVRDPVVHDLSVAESAESAEEFAGDAAHFRPGGVGIDLLEDGADGAAAADGDPEVVDRIGGGIFADGFELFKNALHGFAEVAPGNGRRRDGDDG